MEELPKASDARIVKIISSKATELHSSIFSSKDNFVTFMSDICEGGDKSIEEVKLACKDKLIKLLMDHVSRIETGNLEDPKAHSLAITDAEKLAKIYAENLITTETLKLYDDISLEE